MKREPIIFRFHQIQNAKPTRLGFDIGASNWKLTRSSIFTDCIILHAVKRGLLRTTTADAVLDSVMDSARKNADALRCENVLYMDLARRQSASFRRRQSRNSEENLAKARSRTILLSQRLPNLVAARVGREILVLHYH
jgi:hypothetical protein